MKQNISLVDRGVRFIGGTLLLALGLLVISNSIVRGIALALGVIALLESLIGYCYLYHLLGIDTCQKDRRKLWRALAWLFALCGIGAYLTGWLALMEEAIFLVPTEYWFYDAIAVGIFAVFFNCLAQHQEEKKK